MQTAAKIPAVALGLAIWLAGALGQVACSQTAGLAMPAGPGDQRINTTVFDCPRSATRAPFEFTIRQGPGELALWLPPEFDRPYLVLSQDFAVSGQTFREGDVTVTIAESDAGLVIGTEHIASCTANPVRSGWEHAKLAGVDYRATGTDPDWVLELRHGGNLDFRSISAEIRVSTPTPEPETVPQLALTRYQADSEGQALVVEISGVPCAPADGLGTTGSSVQIRWRNSVFQGCGRSLH